MCKSCLINLLAKYRAPKTVLDFFKPKAAGTPSPGAKPQNGLKRSLLQAGHPDVQEKPPKKQNGNSTGQIIKLESDEEELQSSVKYSNGQNSKGGKESLVKSEVKPDAAKTLGKILRNLSTKTMWENHSSSTVLRYHWKRSSGRQTHPDWPCFLSSVCISLYMASQQHTCTHESQ